MRASIYNAVPLGIGARSGRFHDDFARRNGDYSVEYFMSNDLQQALAGVRAEIDRIDGAIAALLNQRARCAQRGGRSRPNLAMPDSSWLEREAEASRRLQEAIWAFAE